MGIVTGCTISVILFSAAMNLLVKSAEKLRQGAVLASGIQQAPIRPFMDDLTKDGVQTCKITVGIQMVQEKPVKSLGKWYRTDRKECEERCSFKLKPW